MSLLNHPIILSHISIRNLCSFPSINQFASTPIPCFRVTPINLCCHPHINPADIAQIHPRIHSIVPPSILCMCVSSVSIIVIFPRRLPKGSLYPKPVPPTGDATSGPSTYTPALFYHTSASKSVHLRSSCTRETFSTHASLQLLLFLLAKYFSSSSSSSISPTNRFSLVQPAPAFFFV